MQNFNPRVSGLFLLCLVLVYIVILAGGTVRATGAGMGCPDWPKCFGYYIPPTQEKQLIFKPNHSYKKGMMILLELLEWAQECGRVLRIQIKCNPWRILSNL